ncbi:MAG: dTDP-4-amino-4,6-dideoxygalactose transaminase, partial [Actinomycetia bacterium]|nr:dTDP-4-amino-4,6-dideoxygalactose transaminase [Actinomycetes bacterium]
MPKVPFNIPYLTGEEEENILISLRSRKHCGNHKFGNLCIELMKERYKFGEVFLTPSCTAALEMGAILVGLNPGDEVILPSFTFSSTANAVVLRGAKPIFCEIDPQTLNIDAAKIEELITDKTKMILPIDYAGIPCEIDTIMKIAKEYNLVVMHDTAQSYSSLYKGKATGAWTDLAAFSFHETKNFACGEGGALVVNRPEWVERCHFLQEKGTDRSLVLRGIKNKYHWVDYGSSFLLSDLLAAQLYAQLKNEKLITNERSKVTKAYFELYEPYLKKECLKIPTIEPYMNINHHAFWVQFDSESNKDRFLQTLQELNVYAYIGYMPLHSTPMGKKYGYKSEDLPITE